MRSKATLTYLRPSCRPPCRACTRRCASSHPAAFHGIQRHDRLAIRTHQKHTLGRPAVKVDDVPKFGLTRAVDLRIALPNHVHEVLGVAEHPLNAGGCKTEGCGTVICAERVQLLADDLADRLLIGWRQLSEPTLTTPSPRRETAAVPTVGTATSSAKKTQQDAHGVLSLQCNNSFKRSKVMSEPGCGSTA